MPQPVAILMVILSQVQDSSLAFVKPHLVYCCPALQSVQALLNGNTAFRCVSHSSQLCIISKLAEGGLYPFIQVINEDVEQDQTQYQPHTSLATGLQLDCATDRSPLTFYIATKQKWL